MKKLIDLETIRVDELRNVFDDEAYKINKNNDIIRSTDIIFVLDNVPCSLLSIEPTLSSFMINREMGEESKIKVGFGSLNIKDDKISIKIYN